MLYLKNIVVYCSNKYKIYVTMYIYLCASVFYSPSDLHFHLLAPCLFVLSKESDPTPLLELCNQSVMLQGVPFCSFDGLSTKRSQ